MAPGVGVVRDDIILCPSCLAELPVEYPYDHVEIDRAIDGDRDLFGGMDVAQRREVVITALSRGEALYAFAKRLHWAYPVLQGYLPDEHPQSTVSMDAANEAIVRERWALGHSDIAIATSAGLDPGTVGRIRKRLGLAALPPKRTRPTVGVTA